MIDSFQKNYSIKDEKGKCEQKVFLIEEMTRMAQSEGAADIGFADLKGSGFEEKIFGERKKRYPTAISVVVPLSRGVLSEVRTAPTITYFAHYRSVNRLIDSITLKMALLLEKNGFCAFPVPASQSDPNDEFSGVFSHKTAATLSGLGWIGKNALFIHREYGPAVRLGTVLTDLTVEQKTRFSDHCGNCTICRDICPAMAIEGKQWDVDVSREALIDVRACSAHMKKAYQHIGRGVVCGLCVSHCPYSKIGEFSDEA